MFKILIIVNPLLFLMYNIMCHFKKRIIYTIKSKNFIIINDKFFNIQLLLSFINCILISIIAYLWESLNLQFGLALYLGVFWTINYLIKGIAIFKKYAK
ncbi:hypothetical protein SDC9_164349 [bioreactor metagenome]|uniref:Uncharacterized protein n=1 Tax=bioreactor metagenome TaxID=1076179 RepID=A0A645FSW6_9ZZZZ